MQIYKRKRLPAFIIDETVIQIGSQHFGYGLQWNQFIVLYLESTLRGKKLLVAENFIKSLIEKYGRHTVYTDGGTWFPEACNVLRLK